MPYQKELQAARKAAAQAAREAMSHYARFEAMTDVPANITTDADRQAQEIILQQLQREFPDDAFCAEEATATLASSLRRGRRLWIVDPIDGTRGFAKKNGEFSIMIGLVEDGRIVVGLVQEPARSRCTYAVRGEGCWRQDQDQPAQPCHVSKISDPAAATRVRSRSDKPKTEPETAGPPRNLYTYSAGIKLALVARGEADLYVSTSYRFRVWDLCAGEILVEEAGGRVTDVLGKPIIYPEDGSGEVQGVLATNGLLHPLVLAARKDDKVTR
jgi:3'(2'), 5'-bisphosphate nucleotidase